MAANDRQTAHPIINLVVWLVAIGLIVTVAAVAGGRLVGVIGAVIGGDTPLVGRLAVAIGMGVVALLLLLFFGWLVTTLVRNAVAHCIGRRR